jgi:hypothetical protein
MVVGVCVLGPVTQVDRLSRSVEGERDNLSIVRTTPSATSPLSFFPLLCCAQATRMRCSIMKRNAPFISGSLSRKSFWKLHDWHWLLCRLPSYYHTHVTYNVCTSVETSQRYACLPNQLAVLNNIHQTFLTFHFTSSHQQHGQRRCCRRIVTKSWLKNSFESLFFF